LAKAKGALVDGVANVTSVDVAASEG